MIGFDRHASDDHADRACKYLRDPAVRSNADVFHLHWLIRLQKHGSRHSLNTGSVACLLVEHSLQRMQMQQKILTGTI